ncbi:hypothetical protein MMC25_002723 [Agyrium rufum]|nr:hypothetical protein [Agyrium rufum]
MSTKPISCINCAKRKVRCDRLQPCSHCKRRKEDTCEYPAIKNNVSLTPLVEGLVKQQQERIDQLEQIIRRTGGDPDSGHHESAASPLGRVSQVSLRTPSSFDPTSKQGIKRDYNGIFRPNEPASYQTREAHIADHDKQKGYIEVPMWYSWSETRKPDGEENVPQRKEMSSPRRQAQQGTSYHRALLDPPMVASAIDIAHRHPSAKATTELWNVFLTNVHPLTKMFFDWDKAPMMRMAANDPASLSPSQEALVFAIYFMAVISLTEAECKEILDTSEKSSLLDDFQSSAEVALERVGYASATDLLILQALNLYVLAMRDRAKPATLFSLMGIATRSAQLLGLHRDGDFLELPPIVAEERRRTWWQMQQVELFLTLVVGCAPLSVYANWDTKIPRNLEDSDFSPDMRTLPPNRPGLTSMSQVMQTYEILHYIQDLAQKGAAWFQSTNVSATGRDAIVEYIRKELVDKFLQYCELVNPMHLNIQIKVQSFLLAVQRSARQPLLVNTRISDMPKGDRDDFLKICTKTMDYYILAMITPSISQWRWHYQYYFASPALVYVIVEAHHRAATAEAAGLWTTINDVCELHPKLRNMRAGSDLELTAIARLITRAWQQRQTYLERQQVLEITKPSCVVKLEAHDHLEKIEMDGQYTLDSSIASDPLDFELIDWSVWESGPAGQFY